MITGAITHINNILEMIKEMNTVIGLVMTWFMLSFILLDNIYVCLCNKVLCHIAALIDDLLIYCNDSHYMASRRPFLSTHCSTIIANTYCRHHTLVSRYKMYLSQITTGMFLLS